MDTSAEYFKIFNKFVNESCPQIRKSKYSTKYYLDNIIHVLKDVVQWSSLRILHKNKSKYHFKTIEDKYRQWSKLGIFEKTFNELLNKYTLSEIKSSTTLNLFIDSTNIVNKNGTELAVYGENKKKKICKISAICDEKKNVYTVLPFLGSVHDTKTVKDTIYSVTNKMKSYRKINLCGDKGYIMKKEDKESLLLNKIKMVVPSRKNQKIKTNKRTKKMLKKRYTIEHIFQSLKKYNRINLRRDRLIHTYMSFVYLALIINFPL